MSDYITTAQLAERLGMQPVTLRSWRLRGMGPPYIRAGGKVLYPIKDVETWENSNRVEPSKAE